MRDPSDLAIQANCRDALKKLGAQILFTAGGVTVRLEDRGQTIWIKAEKQLTDLDVSVIEEKSFESGIQPTEAHVMKAVLDKGGHLAVCVHFDFNKVTLKRDASRSSIGW